MPGHIDIHHHVVTDQYRSILGRADLGSIANAAFPPWSLDLTYERMAELGIARALLSVSAPGASVGDPADWAAYARDLNDDLAALRDGDTQRLGMLALLPLPHVDASLAALEYAYDTLGADGLILLTSYKGRYLSDPEFDPVLAELDRRNAVVLLHPNVPVALPASGLGHARPGILEFTFDTTRVAADLITGGTMDRYSNISWVLSHLGGTLPFVAWRLGMIELTPPGWWESVAGAGRTVRDYLRRFYYDTAMNAGPEQLRFVADLVGADRLVYGSDTPFGPREFIARTTASLEGAGVNSADRVAVSYGTARGLFGGAPSPKLTDPADAP